MPSLAESKRKFFNIQTEVNELFTANMNIVKSLEENHTLDITSLIDKDTGNSKYLQKTMGLNFNFDFLMMVIIKLKVLIKNWKISLLD